MEKVDDDTLNNKRVVAILSEEPADGRGIWGYGIYDITHIEYNPNSPDYDAWEFINKVEAFIPTPSYYISTIEDKDFDIANTKIMDFCAENNYLVYGEDSDQYGDSIPIFE